MLMCSMMNVEPAYDFHCVRFYACVHLYCCCSVMQLPDSVPLSALELSYRVLCDVMQAQGWPTEPAPPPAPAASSSSLSPASSLSSAQGQAIGRPPAPAAAAAAKPVPKPVVKPDRQTQVILPAAPDTQVPEWFFEVRDALIRGVP